MIAGTPERSINRSKMVAPKPVGGVGNQRNYISENFNKVVFEMKPKQVVAKTEEIPVPKHKSYGKVPK